MGRDCKIIRRQGRLGLGVKKLEGYPLERIKLENGHNSGTTGF